MRILTIVIAAALAASLASCQREGPAEKAGRQVDRAAQKAGDSLRDAGDKIRDAANGKK
jgi:predicted small lipoprotein YifL